MKLGNLDFGGYVFGQSGVQGFFGEGDEYPHHAYYKRMFGKLGFSFNGMSFVAKTVTLKPHVFPETSNTKVRDVYKMEELFPASIWWSIPSIWKGYLLNAVRLPNPGLKVMLKLDKWQDRAKPGQLFGGDEIFQISIALDGVTLEEQLAEVREICALLHEHMPPGYIYPYAIQINLSCPNTGHKQIEGEDDIIAILNLFKELLPGVVLIPKFAFTVAPETISRLQPYCDAFCIGNTIPFGQLEEQVDWKKLFKGGISPLVKQLLKYVKGTFPGGLSGAPLFPVLVNWLERMEACDPNVVIIAGGGIMKKKHIDRLGKMYIVKAIALGSVAIARPWRMQSLIKHGNKVFHF